MARGWNWSSRCARLAGVAILSLPIVAAQDSPLWKVLGPGGGGAMFHPTISALDSSRVLVGCDMTGSYLTTDSGAHWRMFNLRAPASFFAFDPVDPKTLYAYAGGLWRSSDAGLTWGLIYPAPSTVTGLDMTGDHADVEMRTSVPAQKLSALAVDPAGSDRLYAASSAVLASEDRGASWRSIHKLRGKALHMWIDPASPRGDRTIFIATPAGIEIREAGRWMEHPSGAGLLDVAGGFVRGSRKPVFYAIAETGIRVSRDAGASWSDSSFPLAGSRFRAIATSADHGDVAYVSYYGNSFGVARTRDAGRTWEPVWKDTRTAASPNLRDAWINEAFGSDWSEAPLDLGVSPANPEICYATDLGRTVRTRNGGRTWEAVYSRRVGGRAFNTTGLNVTTAYGIQFDPFEPRRMVIDYTDIGLFRSEDGGRSWTSSSAGIPRRWRNTVYWTVFDPEVRGRVWAVASGTHDLPRPKMWRHTAFSRYRGGVIMSEDGGVTWRVINNGMPEAAVTHILLDLGSPASARVLYAAAFGHGVYKSTDGGGSWALRNDGLPGSEPLAWRLTMDPEGALYVILARRSEHGETGDWRDGAIYRSLDGAAHWTKVDLPSGVNGPSGLCVDARDPRRLYLAAWRRAVPGPEAGGGIWISQDRGASWKCVLSKDQHVYDVTQEPARPETLYAAGFESSAWRSTDRGETWRRIRGYNFKWGHRVIVDPRDPGSIYVTTFGGSLWRGPAAGDPNAVEDISTPSLAYSH